MSAHRRRSLRLLPAGVLLFGGTVATSVIGGSLPASAATAVSLFVATSGSGSSCSQGSPCGSIQAAINSAQGGAYNGDSVTINVAAGTYTENDSVRASSLNSLTLAGGGISTTTINGNRVGSVLTVANGSVTISGLTIENGSAGSGTGGGIFNSGTLTVTDSTISDNDALGGGGIESYGGVLTVSDSTIASNGAQAGGGIETVEGTLTISDSTFWGNTAINGGGIASLASSLIITDSTLSGNDATTNGGGIYTESGNDNIGATIVTGNAGSNCYDGTGGTVTSIGYNLTDDVTAANCGFTQFTDVVNALPQLGPLADNGGKTSTLLPALGSPAIGLIPWSPATTLQGVQVCPRIDQRGVASTGNCTIGAVEVEPISITSATPSQVPEGALSATVAIDGSGFVAPVSVTVSGVGVTIPSVSVVSPTALNVMAKVTSTAALGARNVTVSDANGTITCTGCLTITPAPILTSAKPSAMAVGATGSVTFFSSGLQAGATVKITGPSTGVTAPAASIVASGSALTATIKVTAGAATGAYTVKVTNPDKSMASCTSCLSVIAPPTLTSLSPSSLAQGATKVPVTLTGTGFATGAKIKGPAGVTFTNIVVDSTTITAKATIATTATIGTNLAVIVNNNSAAGYGKATGSLLTIT